MMEISLIGSPSAVKIARPLSLIGIFWWPQRDYACWSYRINQRVVELRHGVIWHVAVSIPLSRLQHVDLHRGPLERRYGLASLELHTAGTSHASDRSIDFLHREA